MKKNRISYLITIASLGLVFTTAGCNKSSAHVHDFEFHGEEPSTCHTQGHDAYNVCKSCEKMFDLDGNEITEVPLLELDPNEHEHTKSLVIEAGYKASYTIGDTFDLDNTNFKWKCDLCEGVSLVASAKASLTVTYPTANATCFTAEDATHESVQVRISSTTFETVATVSVNKKDNAILGFEDMDGHCGLSIAYLDGLTASSRSGQAVKYAVKAPGEENFKPREEFSNDYVFVNANKDKTPTVYEVKAYVEGNAEYVEASEVKTLSINHNELVWDTSRDDYDYVGCLCSPEDVTKFNKTVEGVQELIISNGTGSLNLNGSSYDSNCEIKGISITSGETTYNLGGDLSSIPLSVLGENSIFGEQTIKVVVGTPASGDIPACDHILNVNVNIVTANISTADEWKAAVIPATSGTVITGYFRLTSDMTLSYNPAWISGWDKAIFSGIIDGQGHKITLGEGSYGQFYVLQNATLKNMTIHNHWWRRTQTGYCLFAQKSLSTTYENLTFDIPVLASGQDGDVTVGTNYGYLFGNGGAQANAFKNCSWDFGTYHLPSLLGYSLNSTESNTFENCTLNCKDYTEIYTCKDGAVVEAEGLTITTNVTVELDIDPQEIDSNSDKCSITIPEEYSNVKDAFFVIGGQNVSVGSDLTNIVLPETLKTDSTLHGTTKLYVKAMQGPKDVTLEVPVIIITAFISTPAELRAMLPATNPITLVYGYYKATANLNLNNADLGWTELPSGTVAPEFKGTFDGNGITITSKSRLCGIFGDIKGGTIKNFTVTDGWCYGGNDGGAAVLSRDMLNVTVDNVNVTATAWANRSSYSTGGTPITAQNYGWINSRVCQNVTITNCNFNFGSPSNCKLLTLLGTHPSCVNITFSNSTLTCNNYYCLYKSSYTNTVTTTQEGLTITGTCDYAA